MFQGTSMLTGRAIKVSAVHCYVVTDAATGRYVGTVGARDAEDAVRIVIMDLRAVGRAVTGSYVAVRS
jgi:hypothetical protein